MKKIIILAGLTLLSLSAISQAPERELEADSLGALTNVGGVFFQTRYLKYSNGELTTHKTLVGDTATANNFLTNQAVEAANSFAAHAKRVTEKNTVVSKIRDINTALQGATGKTTLDLMRGLYFSNFVDTVGVDKAWRVQAKGQSYNIVFRYMPNGNLRIAGLLDATGAAVGNKTGELYGNAWLVVKDYPTGGTTDLFRAANGRWTTIDRSIIIRLQNAATPAR